MNKKQFQSLGRMASAMRSVEHERQDFWLGFLRGLRRSYHGENFGTLEEHENYMNCRRDEHRRDMQTGYRTGYYYERLKLDDSADVQPLRKLLGLSTTDLADIAAVSSRTVEGWEQGRPISETALQLIRKKLMF